MSKAVSQAVSRSPVIYVWPHLSSDGVTVYSAALHADGALSCNCPAWKMAKKDKAGNPKPRSCKHCDAQTPKERQTLLDLYNAGKPLPPRKFLVGAGQGIVNIASPSMSTTHTENRLYVEDD